MKKFILLLATTLTLSLGAVASFASNEKSIQHQADMTGVERVEISNGVGTITLRRADSSVNHMQLTGTLEGRRSGILRRQKDVSNMDVSVTRRGNRLFIEFQEDNVNADLNIVLPDPEHLIISLGVGTIEGEIGYSRLEVNLGVGDLTLIGLNSAAGRVEMATGVGDASLRGATEASHKRALVAANVEGKGDGTHSIQISVGVGDASITLR